MQGKGATIVAALKADYPGLAVTVDPKTDAVVWPGIGPLDVTIDSGKGGWSFRPSGNDAANAAASSTAQKATPAYGSLASYIAPYYQTNRTPALSGLGF